MTSTNLLNLAKIGQLDPVAYSKEVPRSGFWTVCESSET
jgi:hypothetical protein